MIASILHYVIVASGVLQAVTLAKDVSIEPVYQAEKAIVIPRGDQPEKAIVNLPSFKKQDGKTLCIRFQAYLTYATPGGWSSYLGLMLNDKYLDKNVITGEDRLLNKGECLESTLGKENWWGMRGAMPALLTFFIPNAETLDKRLIKPKEEGCWYLLDISDAANYIELGADNRIESDHPNALAFLNGLTTDLVKLDPEAGKMVIQNLTIGYVPTATVAEARMAFQAHQQVQYPKIDGVRLKSNDGQSLTVSNDGGFCLTSAEDSYYFTASFSYPGDTIGHHAFSMEGGTNSVSMWKPNIKRIGNNAVAITAQASQYQIIRRLTILQGKVKVQDTISNTQDSPLGVRVTNTIGIDRVPTPETFVLAGVEHANRFPGGVAENPTVFVTGKQSSIGIVVEDNVYRLQLELLKRFNTVDMHTGHFGLDTNKEYTMEWSIYPSRDRDYFGFINQVRRDWNVNFTVEGPFVFDANVTPARKARIYAIGPWFDHAQGTQKILSRDDHKARLRGQLLVLRSQQPDAICLGMIETNAVNVDKSNLKGSEILPRSMNLKGGVYGLELSQEQSKLVSGTPYVDSVLKTSDGRFIADTYYVDEPYILLLVYLEEHNYRYRHFLDQIDFLMDEIGLNGVYIDQFSLGWGPLSRKDRCTYDKWDGHTVDIDEKTGRITRQYTDCALVGATARANIIKHVLDKGGKVVANSFPVVRETQSLPAFRFAEMGNDSVSPLSYLNGMPPSLYWLAKGQLASPIILGLWNEHFGEEGRKHHAELIMKSAIAALRNGLLFYYNTYTIPTTGEGAGEYGPINHMFPFTPLELHSGWLVGKERIIACISRNFTWNKPTVPVVYRFDLKGIAKDPKPHATKRGRGWEIDLRLQDWNEIAVIEETPITIEGPSSCRITAYEADQRGLHVALSAAGKGRMQVRSGAFAISPSTGYQAAIGASDKPMDVRPVESDKRGIISIDADFKDTFQLTLAADIKKYFRQEGERMMAAEKAAFDRMSGMLPENIKSQYLKVFREAEETAERGDLTEVRKIATKCRSVVVSFLAGEKQMVEGFDHVVSFAEELKSYATFRKDNVPMWLERGGTRRQSVVWETAVCPQKKDSLLVFAANAGPGHAAAELSINGKSALTFETGNTVDGIGSRMWRKDGYLLYYDHKGYELGSYGLYYLVVPEQDIFPGKALQITVSHTPTDKTLVWFGIRGYRDNTSYGEPSPK